MRLVSKRSLLVVLVLILGITAFFLAPRVKTLFVTKEKIPTFVVKKTSFVRNVSAEGYLRAVKATPLLAPREAQGPLKIGWIVEDGSLLTKGDVVVRFDDGDMLRNLETGETQLASINAQIQKEKLSARAAREGREKTIYLTELELDKTQKFQSKDTEIFSRNQIIESEIDGDLSTARMDHIVKSEGIQQSISRSKLDLLMIERKTAENQIEKAQKALTALEVIAPHNGIFVLPQGRGWRRGTIKVGDTVWSGQTLGEIPFLDEMEAEVFVLEVDAAGLEEGREALVTLESHPETFYQGKVKSVDTLAKPRQQGAPVQYFAAVIELERTEKDVMKPGQRVQATLTLDENESLVIPRQSVFEKDGKPIVYKQITDRFEAVEVKLGSATPGLVVITEGLLENDQIALRDPTRSLEKTEETEEEESTGPPSLGGE